MTKHTHLIFRLSLACLLCCLNSTGNAVNMAHAAETGQPAKKAVWTWVDKPEKGNTVFISRQVGDGWDTPQKISTGEGVNVVPTVTNTSGDNLMVVWTSYTGGQAQLHYRQVQGDILTEEKEFYTGLASNTAPSLSVDGSGKTWLVWAGFNGISDEIYYSTWDGSSFTTPIAITDNNLPDVQPVLGIDDATGTLWVQWLQLTLNGSMKYEATWNGSAWNEPVQIADSEAPATAKGATDSTLRVATKKIGVPSTAADSTEETVKTADGGQLEIEIPEFITQPQSASIHIPGHGVQSLPVRSVTPVK